LLRSLLPWGPGHPVVTSGTGVLVYGAGCITDIELEETTGSATASCTIHDGTQDNQQAMRDYTLLAGQSTSEQWGHHWLPFEEGLYLHTLTGSIKGSITVWLDHKCQVWLDTEHEYYALKVAEMLSRGVTIG
jgi:hypothetical protein